ncbi:MAG: hypothetical protein IH859_01070 [Chloroflexi bacterium]|nr:hypothetical protein [Chloroflexota bacterium]
MAEIASSLAGLRKVKDEVKKYIWYRALLHDIGEICIPQKLLQKPASRSDQEWKLMRRHLISEFSRFTTNLSRNNMRIKIYLIEIKKSRFSHRGSFINLPIFQETTVSASTIW